MTTEVGGGALHLAVFASGAGTNLKNIQDKIVSGALPCAQVSLVISNNSASEALQFAKLQAIAAKHISIKTAHDDAAELANQMLHALEEHSIDLIVLAGYMKKLPDPVVDAYQGRILNVHPALLPKFGGASMYGARVHEAVLAANEARTGATVHLVTKEYDAGPIVLQESCEVLASDTPETLSKRVREIERRILPLAIEQMVKKLHPRN